MAITKTKVTVSKVEDNVTIPKKDGGSYSAIRMTFSVQGVEEDKAFKTTWVETKPELVAALRELMTITSPVQVVIQEESSQYGLNIIGIFPGTTPEDNPRGPKAPKKDFKGSWGGGKPTNEPAIHRQVALKVAAMSAGSLGINTTAGLITAAKELEGFLNELNTKKETPKPAVSLLGGTPAVTSVFAQPSVTA